jgi:hypothetical protein
MCVLLLKEKYNGVFPINSIPFFSLEVKSHFLQNFIRSFVHLAQKQNPAADTRLPPDLACNTVPVFLFALYAR